MLLGEVLIYGWQLMLITGSIILAIGIVLSIIILFIIYVFYLIFKDIKMRLKKKK